MLSLMNIAAPSLFTLGFRPWNAISLPHSNIEQTDTALNVQLDVPGFSPEDVDVTIDGNLLKLRAKHQSNDSNEQKDSRGNVIGRSKYSSSSEIYESFRLPSGLNLDGMSKNVSNGVLHVTIPKLAVTDRPPQQQLLAWPPQVHTEDAKDGKHITLTVPLQGVQKENVRMNIENSNLFLTVLEHGAEHSFDDCKTCTTNSNSQQQWNYRDDRGMHEQRDSAINKQCSRFSERSCVIRLPYGTTADCIHATFENGNLLINVEKKQHRGAININ